MSFFLKSLFIHLFLIGIIALAILIPSHIRDGQSQITLVGFASSLPNPLNKNSLLKTEHSKESQDESKSENTSIISSNGESLNPSEMQSYLQEISNRINRIKKYPESARLDEQEGVVELFIEVSPQGKVVHLEITKPAAFPALNQAAIEAVQKMGDLPPLKEPLKLRIPVQFQLN